MISSRSPSHAKEYFSEALQKSDYYMNDQELKGTFQGKLAQRLGIKGEASKEVFFSLCENRFPGTKKFLTPRQKSNRITGYDINFHCPKSVSVLHAFSKDNHILDAFQASVFETMQDIEADSQTRVRKQGAQTDRKTGELAWGEFTHLTARGTEGNLPDPHLHSHCFVFNATWDDEEKKFKAGKFREIMRDLPFYKARFHKRLSDRLIDLGYQVTKTNMSFEVEGVPQHVIDLFSKRTDQIGRVAKEKGVYEAKQLDSLGALTRSKKQKGLTMAELREGWRKQILDLGGEAKGDGRPIRSLPKKEKQQEKPDRFINHALKHCFERASVMPGRRVLEAAYHHAIGHDGVSLDDLTQRFVADERLINVKQGNRHYCTTKEVLAEERRMVALARQSRNRFRPLYVTPPVIDLKDEQRRAASHVLTTAHGVSIIRGAAGTGKTRMMKETVSLIEKAGKKVTVVAPTAQASRGVLKDEGFEGATTVASLLSDKVLQAALKDQVIWVDESGLLGTQDMKNILELATQKNARLILGGDTRQHASVVRGDALRILNTVAGIRCAELNTIRRQKDARYREAVQDLSQGDVLDGFTKLDDMGAIKTVNPLNPNEELVKDYVEAIRCRKQALIISPTHKQGESVTAAVRKRLREMKLLGKEDAFVKRLSNLNFTEAQKSDWRNYVPGQKVQFNQNLKGIKRGSAWTVNAVQDKKVEILDDNGRLLNLPVLHSGAYDIFEESQIALSRGDKIRVTRNGFDAGKKRLNNGMTLKVQGVNKRGKIIAKAPGGKTAYRIDKDFGHIDHAHCITSYAAQGKSVDRVFVAQPSATFGATDARQFYVSVSRGKEAATIYTDDKALLLEYAAEMGNRQSAIELVAQKPKHESYVELLERSQLRQHELKQEKSKLLMPLKQREDRAYEPGV